VNAELVPNPVAREVSNVMNFDPFFNSSRRHARTEGWLTEEFSATPPPEREFGYGTQRKEAAIGS
jgi:hypothetical protein